MNIRIYAAIIATVVTSSAARAQTLFSETFDSEASAKLIEVVEGQTVVSYVDYSNFTIGATTHGIAEAPNQVTGSAATRGVVIQANMTDGVASLVNLIAADAPGGSAMSFSGDYRLTFDMYLSLDPSATRDSSGTTEFALWGIGNDAVLPISRRYRDDFTSSGTWGFLDEDLGVADDAELRENDVRLARTGDVANLALFQAAFADGSPIPSGANNHWVQVEVSALAGVVTVKYNGVEFFSEASLSTDGFALLGYEDPFTSLSFSLVCQFGLFDNFVIEVATPPTIDIAQTGGFSPVSEEGATSTGEFSIVNNGGSAVTVSEVNLTGVDAAKFSLVNTLPLVVPATETRRLDIVYTAGGERGVHSADIEIVSDDAQSPSLTLPLRGVFAPVLLARYALDETSGTVVNDSSDNGINGAFDVRDPLAYGQASLVGGAGTSIGFIEATFPDGGNFAFMRPLHVPTTSISMWVNPSTSGSGDDTLFNRDPLFTGSDTIYGCFITDGGALVYRAGGEVVLESDPDSVPDDAVAHIVITHLDEDGFGNSSATRSRMYINGAMVAENLSPTGFDAYPANASDTNLYLATRSAAGTGYSGLMDDVQIYSVELNAFQVNTMFNAPGTLAPDAKEIELAFTSFDYNPTDATVDLTWTSLPQRFYIVAESTDLTNWLDIEDSILADGLTRSYEVTGVTPGRRFYRVTLQE